MTQREWKPGDVAMVTHASGAQRRCVRTHSGTWGHFWPDQFSWHDSQVTDVRPFVVLDPENGEHAKRLFEHLRRAVDKAGLSHVKIHQLFRVEQREIVQNALREFANPTPPKPEEPTGHMAVVEDSSGNRWVNWRDPRDTHLHEKPWVMASDGDCREYRDIAAVKVLSEGVVQ